MKTKFRPNIDCVLYVSVKDVFCVHIMLPKHGTVKVMVWLWKINVCVELSSVCSFADVSVVD